MPDIRIGISGWTYDGWKNNFYPEKLPKKKELEYASRQVNSIEVNGTFYRLMKPKSFQNWYEQTPRDFLFSLKANRYITHVRQLKDIDEPLSNFFASGPLCLGKKLGPILWQFPPSLSLKDDRFEKFLKKIPRTSKDIAKLAKKHSEKVEGASWTQTKIDIPVRHAFEFRHPSFKNKDFLSMLREYDVALVFADSGEHSLNLEDITSSFIYARLHGEGAKFKKGYPKALIKKWSENIKSWTAGALPKTSPTLLDKKPKKQKRDCFIYFDNDAKAYAPANARELLKQLKLSPSQ